MGDTGAKTAYKIIKGTVDCIILNPLSNQKEIYNRHGVGEYFAQGALISPHFRHFYDCRSASEITIVEVYQWKDETIDFVEESMNSNTIKWNDQVLLFNQPFCINSSNYEKDEFIYEQNGPGNCFYILVEGVLESTVDGKNTGRKTRPGEIFGAASLILNKTRLHSCQAKTKAKVVILTP